MAFPTPFTSSPLQQVAQQPATPSAPVQAPQQSYYNGQPLYATAADVPKDTGGWYGQEVLTTPMAANDYAQTLISGNPDLVAKMAAIDPNWASRDINGISDLTMQASKDTPVTYAQQLAVDNNKPQVLDAYGYWANSQLGVTPQPQAAPGTGMYAAYNQTPAGPALNMVQDANGFWSNANGAASQAFVNNGLLTQQQKDALASQPSNQPKSTTYTPYAGAPQVNLQQDAQGNWYNANAAAMQAYNAQQAAATAPKVDPTSDFWQIANGKVPQVTDVPSTPNASDLALMAQFHADNLSQFAQDANGNWYNPNPTNVASSNPQQLAVDQWLAAHPNGPQTAADYLEFNKINDPNYVDPSYTPGSFTPTSPGTIQAPYDTFQKYYDAMSGSGSWGADAHAEAGATQSAIQALAGYIKDPKAFAYSADQLTPMLSMFQNAIQYSPTTTVDQYHAAQQDYYNSMGKAFGFDFAGSVAKTGSAKGALSELAQYLTNPANLKKINGGALGQLAAQASAAANKHIMGAMSGDLQYMKTHFQPAAYAPVGIPGIDGQALAEQALQQQMQQYLNSFGSGMPQ